MYTDNTQCSIYLQIQAILCMQRTFCFYNIVLFKVRTFILCIIMPDKNILCAITKSMLRQTKKYNLSSDLIQSTILPCQNGKILQFLRLPNHFHNMSNYLSLKSLQLQLHTLSSSAVQSQIEFYNDISVFQQKHSLFNYCYIEYVLHSMLNPWYPE